MSSGQSLPLAYVLPPHLLPHFYVSLHISHPTGSHLKYPVNQFSGREVSNLEARIDTHILALTALLETKYIAHDKPFDFAHKPQYLTLDILSDAAFSAPLGFLAADVDMFRYIENLEKNFPVLFALTVLPWVVSVIQSPLLRPLTAPCSSDAYGLGRLMG